MSTAEVSRLARKPSSSRRGESSAPTSSASSSFCSNRSPRRPRGSVTLAVIIGPSFAGASLSLSLVLALVGIMLVAVCIGRMPRDFPSAGGFYTFVSEGLQPSLARWSPRSI